MQFWRMAVSCSALVWCALTASAYAARVRTDPFNADFGFYDEIISAEAVTKTLSQEFFHLDFLKRVGLDQTVDFSLSTDIDFEAIVRAELQERKGSNLSDNCTECIVPLAVNACKIAWNKFIAYCDKHKDEKSQEGCDRYKADPKHFLVERVLRATINPIDAGYDMCWWRGKCKSGLQLSSVHW